MKRNFVHYINVYVYRVCNNVSINHTAERLFQITLVSSVYAIFHLLYTCIDNSYIVNSE